jgi:hypothetical protein
MSHGAIVQSERSESYNMYLRLPASAALALYVAATLLSSSTQDERADGNLQHHARDTRAVMPLRTRFSKLHLNLHTALSIATVLLMLCATVSSHLTKKKCNILCRYQKELIYRAASKPFPRLPPSHRVAGRCICLLMFCLASLGYSMRSAPDLPYFDAFSVAFAAPW